MSRMPRQRVRVLGLTIDVEKPLELRVPSIDGDGDGDVEVRYSTDAIDQRAALVGAVLGHLAADRQGLYTLVRCDDGWVLRVHGLCDFEIDARTVSVLCRPTTQCRPDLASVLVGGLLVATILMLRGGFVLHGSAVDTPAGAIAFVGPTGTGKSTLAALCCASGARLIADDVLSTKIDATSVTVHGRSPEIRLRAGALSIADDMNAGFPRRTTVDGRLAIEPTSSSREATRLRAILLPRPNRELSTPRLVRLSVTRAAFELARNTRVAVVEPQLLSQQFDQAVRLVSLVGVYEAHVPWGPPFLPGIAEALLSLGDPA